MSKKRMSKAELAARIEKQWEEHWEAERKAAQQPAPMTPPSPELIVPAPQPTQQAAALPQPNKETRQAELVAKLGTEKVASMAKVKDRVLAAFKAETDHMLNTFELQEIAPEATRRVRELRADGWEITKRYNSKLGVYEYMLDLSRSTATEVL
jgi:hypothetical protein